MSLFYLCTELDCNRKYKTKDKLIKHLLENHKKINDNIIEPVLITDDNKKSVDKQKNETKKKEILEETMKEVRRLHEVEMQAKKEAEEKFKQEQIEKYKVIEQEKISQEETKLQHKSDLNKLEASWIELQKNILERCKENSEECSICFDHKADTAPVPCGHKYFCYDCINNYNKTYAQKGCPCCRKPITTILKIYSA